MSEQSKHKINSFALVIIVLIISISVLGIVGLINDNFSTKKVPVTVEITKSPFRVIYR